MSKPDFPNGAAIVFGGSGGMGTALCNRLAEMGSDVAVCYRSNEGAADRVAGEVAAHGRKGSVHQVDIADKESIRRCFANAVETHGRIHTVMCTAGSDIEQPLLADVTDEQWAEVVNADLNGFFHIAQAAIPHMREKGGGSFVHLSSAGILRTPPRDVLSVAPKMGIEGLVRFIAKEEGENGIRANSIALGVIEAGIFKRLQAQGVFDEAWEQAVLGGLAIKRFGQPEEVADMACFLASDRALYTTGQLIAVDGGFGV
ncbi:MAG: SDR family NAD(P)-dependent oxidoreductase [Alphaproteobacteria bacterium]